MDTKNEYGIREIQEKLIGILMYFKEFCEERGLKFVLAGGTLLGAVRHQGMIPWDDDVDVFMLREDYEKLESLWEKYADKDRFSCVRSNDKMNIHHAVIEIKDNNTTFINYHNENNDIHQGIMIDVIPVDDVAANPIKRFLQIPYAMMFACFNFQRLPAHKSKFMYNMTKLALSMVKSFDYRYRIWKKCEKRMLALGKKSNGQVASFVEGLTIMRQRFPKEWFEHPDHLLFEGVQMPVPKDYKKWLEVSYGDYMTPPKEEDRILRHNIKFYDMKNSYKMYKGIQYCVEKEEVK
ncbi:MULTISPECIES: phosphorylcholine transferase LicD [Terrabacteria group]|uniref:LicD family protein n=1 Tax=Bacillati TaxID=1783272 RepID=UPI001C6F52F2|nr:MULTISPECIES: LicD family protein [Terrabacteria group]MBW9211943.1 LicD family protein [Trueperella sp. zg.1013]